MLVVPVALLLAYGALRVSVTLFTELREFLFYPVAARIARRVALETFEHLLSLSLRFHLERQTGGVSRDIERGSRAIHVAAQLLHLQHPAHAGRDHAGDRAAGQPASTAGSRSSRSCALVVYIAYTITVTEWRTHFRRAMNEQDCKANTRAVDALINYETVKYFGNEHFEQARYDENLQRLEKASIKSQTSLSLLNLGQSLIIAVAVTLLVWRATLGVVEGSLTLGDLVLVNALMIQLYIPLNFLGVIYREIKQSTVDMEKMFALLSTHREIADAPDAQPLRGARGRGALRAGAASPTTRHAPILARRELRDPRRQDGGGGRRVGRRQVDAGAAAVPLLRRRPSGGGASRSTARTSAASRRPACARPSASCRRTRCCSTTRSNTTSPMAARAPAVPRSRARRARRTSTISSRPRRRATTRWSASAA